MFIYSFVHVYVLMEVKGQPVEFVFSFSLSGPWVVNLNSWPVPAEPAHSALKHFWIYKSLKSIVCKWNRHLLAVTASNVDSLWKENSYLKLFRVFENCRFLFMIIHLPSSRPRRTRIWIFNSWGQGWSRAFLEASGRNFLSSLSKKNLTWQSQ